MSDTPHGWPERLARVSVRHRSLVVALACALTAALAIPAVNLVRLRIRTNFVALLPADQPSVQTLNRVIDKLGGWGDLMVVIDSPDRAANTRFAAAVQTSLANAAWVNHSEYRVDDGYLARHALLLLAPSDLEEIRRRLQARRDYEVSQRDPFFVDLLEEGPPPLDFSDIEDRYRPGRTLGASHASRDGRTLVLAVYPKGVSGNIRDTRQNVADLEARVNGVDRSGFPADLRVRIGGTFHDRLEEYDAILRDLVVGTVVMIALFVLLIGWQYRQAVALPIVLLPCLLPAVWTFAAANVIVAELNLITVFLANIIVGLGIDFSIHGYSRFLEERADGADTERALAAVNRHTVPACRSAALTTIVAFLVLVPMRFLGFRQFGIIAAIGLALAFVSATLLMPSLIAIADERGWIRFRRFQNVQARKAGRLAPRVVIALSAVMALAGLVGLTRVDFEYDFSKLRTTLTTESQALRDTVRSIFAGARDPVVILADDLAETVAVQSALRDTQRSLGDRAPFQSVVSVFDVMPLDQPARLAVMADIRALVEEMAPFVTEDNRSALERYRTLLQVDGVTLADLPESLRRRFFGVEGSNGNLIYVLHTVPLADTRQAAELVSAVRTVDAGGKTFHAASDAVVIDDLLRVMREDSRIAIPLSALAVFVVLLADFRSVRRAIVAIVPLTIGMLWLMAILWVTGTRLNFYNMVVIPSLFGMAVDAGIHYYHRFLEEPDSWTPERAGSTKLALVTTTLTNMISFGSLAASVHQGFASMGQLAVVGLACILVSSLVLMPAILTRYRGFCAR